MTYRGGEKLLYRFSKKRRGVNLCTRDLSDASQNIGTILSNFWKRYNHYLNCINFRKHALKETQDICVQDIICIHRLSLSFLSYSILFYSVTLCRQGIEYSVTSAANTKNI